MNVEKWKIQNSAIGEEKNVKEIIATIQSISRQNRLPLVVEEKKEEEEGKGSGSGSGSGGGSGGGGKCAWTPYVEGGKRKKKCSDVLRDIYDDECFLGKMLLLLFF